MRGLIVRWLLVVCFAGANCLLAQPFFFRKDIAVGSGPLAVIAGDFNGDGRADLAITAWYEGIVVVPNAGGGNLGRPIRTGIEVNSFPLHIMVADFNGDGKDDLLTPQGVFLSRGDGTFQPVRPISMCPPSTPCTIAAVGDFDRDGKSDVIISGAPNAGTRVLLGNGDGSFRSGPTITGLETRGSLAVVADFNRDGRSDIAFPSFLSPPPIIGVVVFLGNGDGTFGAEIRTATGWVRGPNAFFAADFNGDGIPDLAAPNGILLGKGDGTFQYPLPYPFGGDLFGEAASVLAAADFTGDAKPDLVVTRGRSNSIFIFPGKGDGTFLPLLEQSVGYGWRDFGFTGAAVDLDGDGRLDLAVTNDSSNTVSVLMAKAQGGPALRRAVSAASATAIVAPQSLATLFGPTTATASAAASPPWPTRLGGISIQVRDSAGATSLAPLLFVSPTQINFQVPALTALGEAQLAIVSDSGTAQAGSMEVDAVAPALFMASLGSGTPIAMVQVGSQAPVLVQAPISLSTAGDTPIYLSFFGTGFHGANPDNVICTDLSSGVRLPVLYAGPHSTPGVDQINIRLLPEMVSTYGSEVSIRIDGVPANSAWINIQ